MRNNKLRLALKAALSAVTGLLTMLIAVGCSQDSGGSGGGSSVKELIVGGSTFVEPMMREWAHVYNKEKGIKIDYKARGSGKGIQQMTERAYSFGCTDAPMNSEELKAAKDKAGDVLHIPLVIGAVVPAYKLEGVTESIKFSGPVLADIFLGNIKTWDDKALKDLNPD